ncbi:long-chain-fatty-acid--CoA ligase [Gemmatimonadetes bacterium T265]|nr:long-chain-fatty-acid--CoA ligase [Gemmatimonadetes bacterium T265]
MPDPLAVVPYALAAAGGRVDAAGSSDSAGVQHFDAGQLTAAGLTLLRRSAPLVRALAGRRAAILLPTSPAFLVALAACEGRGAVLVNPLAAPPEIADQLADADVGAVFTIGALAARLPAGTPHVLLDAVPAAARVVAADGTTRDLDLAAHAGDALALEGSRGAEGRDEEAAVVYTSAMRGRSLGAVLTHRNLLSNARATVEAGGLRADDHALAVLPFSHLFGLVVAGLAPLLAGARVTTMARFNPITAADLIARGGVTFLVGVPAVFAALVQAAERRGGLGANALRTCICGGAPLPVALQERWHAVTGAELRQGYGLTEAGPVCLFNRVDRPNRRGTLGVPFPGVAVAVRDEQTGAPCATGARGEICVCGPNVGPGYVSGGADGLGRWPDVPRDSWLRTGDLGSADADGYVTFHGVCKPMFTRNGFNVYPRELERVVGAMPGVRHVTVRAVPDPAREHDIALDVQGGVTPDAVKAWCAARLSAYKQPSEITVR